MVSRKLKRKNYKLIIILILYRVHTDKGNSKEIYSVYIDNVITHLTSRSKKSIVKDYINNRVNTDLKDIISNAIMINFFERDFYYFKNKYKKRTREKALTLINKLTTSGRYHLLLNRTDITQREAIILYKKLITYKIKRGNKIREIKF